MASPKTTATIIVVVALLFASVAAYMVYNYLSVKEEEAARAKMQVRPIVVAAVEVPFGSRVQEQQLAMADWPKDNLPAGCAYDPGPLVGRLAVARITAGNPVLESSLAPANTSSGVLSYILPEGMRAVTVGVNEVVGVAGFVLPNSIVDVVATVNTPYQDAQDRRISKIVLQSIKVIAVGQILEQKDGAPVQVPTVTLEVTPQQAEKLTLASENKVQLILRNINDKEETKTKGETITSLLGNIPRTRLAMAGPGTGGPASLNQRGPSMVVIKGSTKSVKRFQ